MGVAAASVVVVALVAWLGLQAFTGADEPPALTVGGDSMAPVDDAAAAVAGPVDPLPEPIPPVEGASDSSSAREAEIFFTLLPTAPNQRAAVYDSLWQARSPVLAPLFERVEGATEESTVRRAFAAWRSGSLTPLQRDLLHSALVQYALRQEMGAELALDGQLLRNPCRGASCSALLNFWETRGSRYGLPPVPEDAPRNTTALHTAESVLVLRTLETLHLGGGTISR
jgi:hypothetical protein